MAGAEAALGASASTAMPGAGVSPGVSRWIGIRASKDQLVMH
jgi:saccharopine dehydrogenase-like NADP-dependent oxidoreductase